MGYQVAITPSARRDLQEIVRYLSADAPDRALAFGQKLVNSTRMLGQFPELGRVVPELREAALREIVVRSYRIIYRVDHADCRVDVLRFWHGARGTSGVEPG